MGERLRGGDNGAPAADGERGTGVRKTKDTTEMRKGPWVSDSVRPYRWQPTRLPCPWDSPGKNTGVGCHFLLQCMKVKSESEVA